MSTILQEQQVIETGIGQAAEMSPRRVIGTSISGARLWPSILWNEMIKGLIIRWSYRFNMITEMVMFVFLYTGISFFMGRGSLERDALASSLIGYIMWFFAIIAISNMSWGLREEANSGTLEQMYMSPAPPSLVQLGRTLAALFFTTLQVLLMTLALFLLLGFTLPWQWSVLVPFLLTMMGLYGFGFLIGGATLIFKQVEALVNLFTNVLLFINGSFVPVSLLPEWLETMARLLPTTEGIIVMRRILLEGDSLAATLADGSLMWLTIHSVIYFTIGLLVFNFCERIARQRGLLGQY